MSWNYSGDPSASTTDWVRWRIGDTDSSDKLLEDEEIAAAVSTYGNKKRAAVECCRAIAAKYARKVDKAVGDLRLSASQAYQQYLAMAEEIVADGLLEAKPYAGGISESDKSAQQKDTDRVVPAFSRDQFDHPQTIQNIESQSTGT